MRYTILIILIACLNLASFSQSAPFVPFPPESQPASVNSRSKGNNKGVVVNDIAKLKKTVLSKIKILTQSYTIDISYQYDKNSQLNKVEYKYSNGQVFTHSLFYDEKGRLSILVNEYRQTATGNVTETSVRIFTYDANARVNSSTSYNSANQPIETSTYGYEGNTIQRTSSIGIPGTKSVSHYSRYTNGDLQKAQGSIEKVEYPSYVQYRDPTSYLPETYSGIYGVGSEFVWYIMEGNKNLPYKRISGDKGQITTTVITQFKVNADGRVTYVNTAPEGRQAGTSFTFEYTTQ